MCKMIVVVLMMALCAECVSASPTASDRKTAVMAVVMEWLDKFNKQGPRAVVVTCADQTSIIGAFPPYTWTGVGACGRWANDWVAFSGKDQLDGCAMAPATAPRHFDSTSDRAYVVLDAVFTCDDKRRPLREPGWTWTVALKKAESGWQIVGWTWASPADSGIRADK